MKVSFFGCGKIARDFYLRHQSELEVERAISNNKKEKCFSPKDGIELEVERPKAKKGGDGRLIVITAEAYEEISRQLILLGFSPMVDFIDYELMELLLTGKKVALFYGFCHIRGVADCLKHAPDFVSQYQIFYYANYLPHNAYQEMRFSFLLGRCDFMLYGLELDAGQYRLSEAVQMRLKPEAEKMCLPAVFFGGYFPQETRWYNAMNPYAVKVEGYDYTPFSYGDSWLNHCIDRGMDVKAIIRDYRSNIYEKEFIFGYQRREMKHLRFQEQKGDFLFVEFINENYRIRRLFRNEAHMENDLLLHYAVQILQEVHCKTDMLPISEPLMRCSEHPVFPCVADMLGLEWDVETELLDVYTYGGWKKVNAETYIKLYIESCRQIRELKKHNLLP